MSAEDFTKSPLFEALRQLQLAGCKPEVVDQVNEPGLYVAECPSCREEGRTLRVFEQYQGAAVSYQCRVGCTPGDVKIAGKESALGGLLELAPKADPKTKRRQPGSRDIGLRKASDFKPRPIKWLWKPYLPLGKVSILAGPQGQGKSTFTNMLAAQTTTNQLHPSDLTEAGGVVLVSAEDDPNDIIAPRLTAAGAVFEHINILDVREANPEGAMTESALSLPDDGPMLIKALERTKAKLIIVDPVSSFLTGSTDAHKNTAVRRALAPLKMLAEATGAAVLCVTHLSKGGGTAGEPLDRVIDSVAFTALARSVLLFAADPDDEEGTRGRHKIVLVAKSNIAPPGDHALRVLIHDEVVHTETGEQVPTSKLEVVERAPDITAGDLLMPPDERSQLSQAMEWLKDHLAEGWMPSDPIQRELERRFSKNLAWRARENTCGRARKAPVHNGGWYLGLKRTPPPWADNPAWSNDGSPYDPSEDDVAALRDIDQRADDARRQRDRMLGERDDDDDHAHVA